MLREFLIIMYLSFFRLIFFFFKQFPQKKQTLFMSYFGYNVLHTMEAIERVSDERIIVVKTKHCRVSFNKRENRKVIDLDGFHPVNWVIFVYHLATSNKVIVDNYYGFLAVSDFKPNTICVQLWHAAGAIKKFGLLDASIQTRSNRALKRFKSVYNRFTHVVVGSDEMSEIFCQCFGISEERILKTGIPRTDFFFNNERMIETKKTLEKKYPLLNGKKVILYAPTFRDDEPSIKEFPLRIDQMHKALKDDYVLLLKTHPIVKNQIQNKWKDFVLNVSNSEGINDLLLVTDILISDYSSIPFEFSLLEKPMIFYAYDLDMYKEKRGVFGNYEEMVPGPCVKTTDEIIDVIQQKRFDTHKILSFKEAWNTYSDGNSSKNLAEFLLKNR